MTSFGEISEYLFVLIDDYCSFFPLKLLILLEGFHKVTCFYLLAEVMKDFQCLLLPLIVLLYFIDVFACFLPVFLYFFNHMVELTGRFYFYLFFGPTNFLYYTIYLLLQFTNRLLLFRFAVFFNKFQTVFKTKLFLNKIVYFIRFSYLRFYL